MKERHQEKNGKNETRARALAAHDRNYWVGLLETVDTWFPVYRVRHPDVDRAEIVARLASLIDERRRRGFPDHERPAPPGIPDTAVLFESPLARRGIRGILDTPFATTSGVAKASAFKLIDIETKSKADTQDLHTFSPLGGPGGSSFEGAHGAFFWTGFSRLDSTWDQVNIFEGSPSDRVVHMAVVQINLPPPTTRVIARIRTWMFIDLAQGVEIINDWGLFDDEDDASLKIDFCGAFTRDGLGFPDPEAFGFSSAFSFFSSTHKFQGQDADMSRTEVLFPGDKPSLFLGMRWTFAGADTRMQTGFTQQALNSFFGFAHPDRGLPGVLFSYDPELVVTQ
jgi:hypothetical protein